MRGIAVGRRNRTFCGSDSGRHRAAVICTLIETAKLSDADKRAYILADNKRALNAGWDKELLALELQGFIEAKYDIDLTGFSIGEADIIIAEAAAASPQGKDAQDDAAPEVAEIAVSRRQGHPDQDTLLGRYRALCHHVRLRKFCRKI